MSRLRLPSWLRRDRYEAELEEEMWHHIEARADDLAKEGMEPDEARRVARREFGSMETAKDYCRDQDGVQWLDELRRNLSFARRRFLRRPGLFVTVVVTLGLCLGLNAIIFGVVDAVLLRTLPYPDPDGLLVAETVHGPDGTMRRAWVDGRTWEALEQGTSTLELAVFSSGAQGVNFVPPSSPEGAPRGAALVQQQRVGAGFFDVLGVPLARGRGFLATEDVPGGPAVAVVSWRLWQDQLGAGDDVVGSSIALAGEPHTVVGVTAADFDARTGAEVWVPLRPSTSGEGGGTNYQIIARHRDGVTAAEVETELAAVAETLRQARGDEHLGLALTSLQATETAQLRAVLIPLWGAVALVLLIGCVNVAGLLLATAEERADEIATRRAMGGGMSAVVRQLLTESLFLGLCGAVAGAAVGVFGLQRLQRFVDETLGLWQPIQADWRVFAAVGAVGLLATLVFGSTPAWVMARASATGNLRSRGATRSTGRLRRALVVLQVGLGLALLLSATLMIRSLLGLAGGDPGVEADGLLSASVSLRDARFDETEAVTDYFRRGRRTLEQAPGIVGAAAVLSLPFERGLNMGFFMAGEEDPKITSMNYVSEGALELMGLRLLRGRTLDERDSGEAVLTMVVSRSFESEYFPEGAVGRSVKIADVDREIVGVVDDVRQVPSFGGGLAPLADDVPTVYVPVGQLEGGFYRMVHTWFRPDWIVRTTGPSGAAEVALRESLAAVDPLTPVAEIRDLGDVRQASLRMQRFQAVLFAGIAFLALVLASVGVAGISASSVAERRRELGIRIALGSTVRSAIGRAALPGLTTVAAGLVLGLVMAQLGAGAIGHLIYGIGAHDLPTNVLAALALLVVAGAACLLPALRVGRLPLATTLQDDA